METTAVRLSASEIGEKGEVLYQSIRSTVDTKANHGMMISIDVGTSDYEIDAVGITAASLLAAPVRLFTEQKSGLMWFISLRGRGLPQPRTNNDGHVRRHYRLAKCRN